MDRLHTEEEAQIARKLCEAETNPQEWDRMIALSDDPTFEGYLNGYVDRARKLIKLAKDKSIEASMMTGCTSWGEFVTPFAEEIIDQFDLKTASLKDKEIAELKSTNAGLEGRIKGYEGRIKELDTDHKMDIKQIKDISYQLAALQSEKKSIIPEIVGFWWKITSPFTKENTKWFAGLTPHGVTGWNSRPDYQGSGETLGEAIKDAMMRFEKHEPTL
jgi:hypothetical protein